MKNLTTLGVVCILWLLSQSSTALPIPTPSQLEYQDWEIGAMISFDMYTFTLNANISVIPPASLFNPSKLNTDKWIEAAAAFGAKYAVLTAKHDCGFCLWNTKYPGYDYSVKQWHNGSRDIVAEFVASCKKYGVKPAIYYSVSTNFYKKVLHGRVITNNSQDQQEYNKIVEFQLTELWSSYGELAELWFDGGLLSPNQGGPDVLPILMKYQPNALVFGPYPGIKQCVRWVGNEDGVAPDPNWATCSLDNPKDECVGGGAADGKIFCPAECDTVLRGKGAHEWFWEPDGSLHLKSVDELVDEYLNSVGHNCNFMLGINPNRDGLIDHVDMQRYIELGATLSAWSDDNAIASTSGGATLTIDLGDGAYVDTAIIMEDLQYGQSVTLYVVEAQVDNVTWKLVSNGTAIGHKKIDTFSAVWALALRFRSLESLSDVHIRKFSAFFIGD